jgi:hypothetical protein
LLQILDVAQIAFLLHVFLIEARAVLIVRYSAGDEISVSYNEPILCPFERALLPTVSALSFDPVTNASNVEMMSVVCEGRKIKLAFAPTTDFRALLGKRVVITIRKVRDLAKNEGVTATAAFMVGDSQSFDRAGVERKWIVFAFFEISIGQSKL